MKEGEYGNFGRLGGTHGKKTTKGKKTAIGNGADTLGVTLADFRAYMPQHNYLYIPSRQRGPEPASTPEFRRSPWSTQKAIQS
jgi:hypothetical protein